MRRDAAIFGFDLDTTAFAAVSARAALTTAVFFISGAASTAVTTVAADGSYCLRRDIAAGTRDCDLIAVATIAAVTARSSAGSSGATVAGIATKGEHIGIELNVVCGFDLDLAGISTIATITSVTAATLVGSSMAAVAADSAIATVAANNIISCDAAVCFQFHAVGVATTSGVASLATVTFVQSSIATIATITTGSSLRGDSTMRLDVAAGVQSYLLTFAAIARATAVTTVAGVAGLQCTITAVASGTA